MSRVGKMPISLPAGADVTVAEGLILIKGPLGSLSLPLSNLVSIENNGNILKIQAANESREANAMSGTIRALVNNQVNGVTKGFKKKLLLVGVGFRAAHQDGKQLTLSIGFSHPVIYQMPDGIKCETPSPTEIIISGIDKQRVGQVAAEIRAYRPPEPYKGKGIRYEDEKVLLKEAKKK